MIVLEYVGVASLDFQRISDRKLVEKAGEGRKQPLGKADLVLGCE